VGFVVLCQAYEVTVSNADHMSNDRTVSEC
jgi:hypothetical protein